MTREEAMAYALRKKAGLESEINKSNCEYGKWVTYSAELDFTNACISALKGPTREQVEKVWRGEWVLVRRMAASIECKCPKCQRMAIFAGRPANFCEKCGSANTDEAVDMVMERLERLRDEKG